MGSKSSILMPAVTAAVFVLGLLAGYYFVIVPTLAALGL